MKKITSGKKEIVVMINPQHKKEKFGLYEIERMVCSWLHEPYKTTIYTRLNGRGVVGVCDCPAHLYKKKCYHLSALEQWAQRSKE